MKAVLVYQAGLANVFEVECFNLETHGRNAKRLLQGSFLECESFARGLAAAGASVGTVYCNMAGDIEDQPWNSDLRGAPFSESFRPVWSRVKE